MFIAIISKIALVTFSYAWYCISLTAQLGVVQCAGRYWSVGKLELQRCYKINIVWSNETTFFQILTNRIIQWYLI